MTTAAHAFSAVTDRSSDRAAVRHGERTVRYAELAGMAGGVAALLQSRGIGRGDVVATLLERSVWCPAVALGAWAAGAAYAHIDPGEPSARVATLLETTGAGAVLVDGPGRARPAAGGPLHLVLDETLPPAPYRPVAGPDETDRAYLVLTSGSTGRPKAVSVPHRALLNYVAAFRGRIAPLAPGSFGTTTTFASDLGNTMIYGALLSGGRLDIYDRATVLDPAALAAELRRHPVDCLKFTPTHLAALANGHELADLLPGELLVFGGESLPPGLVAAVLDARPELTVYNHYGPSEATVGVLMHRIRQAPTGERVPLGTPLSGVVADILDDVGRAVPETSPGELYLSGACLSDGYVGDPAATERAFVQTVRGRSYRTGDLVVRNAEGDFEFLGRTDRQLKIRGQRVEPAEIEAVLLALPFVRQAVVVGERPSPQRPLELVAYAATDAEPRQVAAALADALPGGWMPSRIHAVPAMPITPNGKTDLAALRALARAEAADGSGVSGVEGPRGEIENLVARAWCAVLSRAAVGRDERFTTLGGDSFTALLVLERLRARFPAMTVSVLTEHSTVSALAGALEAGDY
jgi:amino acid adenylation domain-containing protein